MNAHETATDIVNSTTRNQSRDESWRDKKKESTEGEAARLIFSMFSHGGGRCLYRIEPKNVHTLNDYAL